MVQGSVSPLNIGSWIPDLTYFLFPLFGKIDRGRVELEGLFTGPVWMYQTVSGIFKTKVTIFSVFNRLSIRDGKDI